MRRVVTRSDDYSKWILSANAAWGDQFPGGISKIFKGRLAVYYVFVWPIADQAGISSDIGNREKVLSDFLQHKFFENDCQIDEQRQYRNLWGNKRPYAIVRVSEVKDTRYTDPMKRFENWQ